MICRVCNWISGRKGLNYKNTMDCGDGKMEKAPQNPQVLTFDHENAQTTDKFLKYLFCKK